MSYLLFYQILSSLVLKSTSALEITISASKLFHAGIFLKANEFNLTDLFALGLFSFGFWPHNWVFSANEKNTFISISSILCIILKLQLCQIFPSIIQFREIQFN